MEVNEAINEYYNLKKNYKSGNIKKCIICGEEGGSIFKAELIDDVRHLIAKCGNKSKPCKLNIDIAVGNILYLDEYLKELKGDINNCKLKIITYKYNLIYGYITKDDAIKLYDKYDKEIKNLLNLYDNFLEFYNSKYNNNELKKDIQKLESNIQTYIADLKELVIQSKYKEAIELYLTSIKTDNNELHDKKNDLIYGILDGSKNEFIIENEVIHFET
jgi:hypothetical protein